MSKYEEIASIIRTRISDGTYPIDSIGLSKRIWGKPYDNQKGY